MQYKWLHGYKAMLANSIDKKQTLLTVSNQTALYQSLNNSYSFLTLSDGVNTEIVKVEQYGTQIKMIRGQEGTEPQSFPSGACIKWEPTKTGICDTLKQCDKENDKGCDCQ